MKQVVGLGVILAVWVVLLVIGGACAVCAGALFGVAHPFWLGVAGGLAAVVADMVDGYAFSAGRQK